jgi:hypothetical protein
MSMAWSKDDRRENAAWVRAWYAEHPQGTVDEAAKAAHNARHTIHRDEVAAIRRQMQREQQERERMVLEHTVRPRPPLLRPAPKAEVPAETAPEPAPPPPPPEAAAPEPRPPPPPPSAKPADIPPEAKKRSKEGMRLRQAWLADYLLEHPQIDTKSALEAVRAHFGLGIDLTDVCRMVRDVRVAAGLPLLGSPRSKAPSERRRRRPRPAADSPEPAPRLVKALAKATKPSSVVAPSVDEEVGRALVALGRAMAARGRTRLLVVLAADGSVSCEPVEEQPQAISIRKGTVRL